MSILVQANDSQQSAYLVDSGGKRKISAAELGAYEQAGMKPAAIAAETVAMIPDALIGPLRVGTVITGSPLG